MMYSNHVEIKMMFNVNFRILFPELLLVMWHDAELPMSCIYIYIYYIRTYFGKFKAGRVHQMYIIFFDLYLIIHMKSTSIPLETIQFY